VLLLTLDAMFVLMFAVVTSYSDPLCFSSSVWVGGGRARLCR